MADVQGKSVNGIISIERSGEQVITLDGEGRIIYFSDGSITWKRSLNNSFIRIGWENERRIIEKIPGEKSGDINSHGYSFLKEVSGDLTGGLSEAVSYILEKKESWIEADSEEFNSVYGGSFPIVPQDQRFSLYFQLTSGAKWNNTTFVTPAADVSLRSEEEFTSHVNKVKDQFGKGLELRRSAFLGDASALNLEQKELLRAMDIIRENTGLPLYTFVDAFSVPKKKNMIHYGDMKRHGLSRVYVGIQSGSVSLLRHFEKLKNVSEILNLVNNLKNSGISVGLIVLAGYGGKKFSQDHVRETASIISQMNLDENDIIYISPMDENDDPRYSEVSHVNGFEPMNGDEKLGQADELERSIKEEFKGSNRLDLKTQISRYDIREGIY